jgi:hypothetical protein
MKGKTLDHSGNSGFILKPSPPSHAPRATRHVTQAAHFSEYQGISGFYSVIPHSTPQLRAILFGIVLSFPELPDVKNSPKLFKNARNGCSPFHHP